MSVPAKMIILGNKRDKEVAKVIVDETFPPGWSIESNTHQRFEHKVSTELAACNIWHLDFDPETERLRQQR